VGGRDVTKVFVCDYHDTFCYTGHIKIGDRHYCLTCLKNAKIIKRRWRKPPAARAEKPQEGKE